MGTTVGDAIEQARNRLRPLFRETLNVLAADFNTGDTQLTLTYDPEGVTVGSTLGIGTEDVVVVLPPEGKTVTVLRAQHGTSKPASAGAHANGTVVEVKPAHSRGMLQQALLEELRSWPPDLFVVQDTIIATAVGRLGYDLGLTDQVDILDTLRIWDPTNDSTRMQARSVPHRLIRQAPTSLSATNECAVILDWSPRYAVNLQLEYAAPFNLATFTTDTELVGNANVGLSASMFDLAWMGCARRRVTEVPRTDEGTQPSPRIPDDVPAGLVTSVRRQLDDEYLRRRSEEHMKLLRRYPPRG